MPKPSISSRQQEILSKKQRLESASAQLKKEFLGIDNIIDQVIRNISSWYLFPNIQEKPIVVNLFGLTGVGKTDLIRRLVELLDFQNKYYHFDLGEKEEKGRTFRDMMEDIFQYSNGKESVLVFDEIQHIRTLKPSGEEIERPYARIMWELLDKGTFKIQRDSYSLEQLHSLYLKLEYLLRNGAIVKNGIVVSGKELYLKETAAEKEYQGPLYSSKKVKSDNILFIPQNRIDDIFTGLEDKFKLISLLESHIKTLDGVGSLRLIRDAIEVLSSFKTVDCCHSIIFIIGNLDTLFSMHADFNPDMSPDQFHEQSLKITVPQVKEELGTMFRSEQVARLGNNYILYPAFDGATFKRIISLELERIQKKVKSQEDIQLEFDDSFKELIFKEGVYPTQGTRPVYSTIYNLVYTKLGAILEKKITKNLDCDKVVFSHVDDSDKIEIGFYKNKHLLFSFSEEQNFSLKNLRENKKNGQQANVAVHESGHVIAMIIALGEYPERVFSMTADSESAGFVLPKLDDDKITTKEYVKQYAAMTLAGHVAEEIIFGKEKVSLGSSSDIESATNFITRAIKTNGISGFLGKIECEEGEIPYVIHDKNELANKASIRLLKDAEKLAKDILKREKKLLLATAKYLSENTTLGKEKLKELVKKHAVAKIRAEECCTDKNLYYKETLNKAHRENCKEN